MSESTLLQRLQAISSPKVAVFGDLMLDHYVWGDAVRVSPEAPVPVVQTEREERRLGGAGNVASNLHALGAEVSVFGSVGADAPGDELRALLEDLCRASYVEQLADRPTVQKIRVLARSQQMLRVDREDCSPLPVAHTDLLLRSLCQVEWDVLVLSDYGKGTLTPEVLQTCLAEAKRRGVPAIVDPKHADLSRYQGATVVTPNRSETEASLGRSTSSLDDLAKGADGLRESSGVDSLLVTLGADGMLLLRAGEEPLHLPTAARQVYDVTGAGDTVVATLAFALAGGLHLPDAMSLANSAAGLAVARIGSVSVSREELRFCLQGADTTSKIAQADSLAACLTTFRRDGSRVVFTNGCFDILHAGHVRYLQEARSFGDVLVIGVNDDDSIQRLKGKDRPFNNLADRLAVLAALECVDLVVAFSEDTPETLIQLVCPDVLVKGADWKVKGVVGSSFVEAQGGEVRLIDLLPGRSTSGLADRIRHS